MQEDRVAVETQPTTPRTVKQFRRTHAELNHSVRAMGHDMTANLMVLENSFSRLKRLLQYSQGDELGEVVAHIDACLAESKSLLTDLRGLARTGSVEMEPSRVDLGLLVNEILFEQRDLLRSRGIQVDVRSPLAAVWCNRQRAKQVLTNLIRNAAIHGCDNKRPKLSISTSWKAATDRNTTATVAIHVHDNGSGIDPAVADEIFLPGRRLSDRSEGGSGMGLAIVRGIVEHYGGSVKVDLQCKSGTAIEATLPAALDPHPVSRPHWERASTPEGPTRLTGHDAPHRASPHSHPPRSRRNARG